MAMCRRIATLLAFVLGTLGAGGALHADERDHELAREALQQGLVLPLRQVLDKVEREYQGQVLAVTRPRGRGQAPQDLRSLWYGA